MFHLCYRLLVVHPDIVGVAKSHIQPIRFPKVTYNDMTKPEGPWQEKYDALNAEYSRYMYLGICSFVVSLGIVRVLEFPHK